MPARRLSDIRPFVAAWRTGRFVIRPKAAHEDENECRSLIGDGWGALMEAAQDGCQDEYRRLLSKIEPWLRCTLCRDFAGPVLDLAIRDILMTIHTYRHTCGRSHHFKSWLIAIASHRRRQLAAVKTQGIENQQITPDRVAWHPDRA